MVAAVDAVSVVVVDAGLASWMQAVAAVVRTIRLAFVVVVDVVVVEAVVVAMLIAFAAVGHEGWWSSLSLLLTLPLVVGLLWPWALVLSLHPSGGGGGLRRNQKKN